MVTDDWLYSQLLRWRENRPFKNEPWVFVDDHPGPNFGKRYKVRRHFLNGLCDKAGVKRFGSHAPRRFVASTLSGKYKFSTATIQQILGHEKITTTEIYIQNIRNDVQQAMDMLAEGQDWILNPDEKNQAKYPKSTPLDFEAASPAGFEPASPA
ncbi:MAG: tyrosine-type recombinase/integrase [Syntrophobacteraceae bacterium]